MTQWALITGASSGIGLELAKLFAANGFNLVLVARNETTLQKLADELRPRHGIEVRTVTMDLTLLNAAEELFESVRDVPIAVLVNNAGCGYYGAFATSHLREQTEVMQLNMTALVQLTHLFLRPMLARGTGRILNVASTAAFQPGPMINVYYASKACVFSFSCALANELKGSGVSVTVLCPGTTQTEFFRRGRFGPRRAPFTMSAPAVARAGYRGLMEGKAVVIPGLVNKATSTLARMLPPRFAASIARRIHEH